MTPDGTFVRAEESAVEVATFGRSSAMSGPNSDGLIERLRAPLDDGFDWLTHAGTRQADRPLEEFCDALLAEIGSRRDDDVALAEREELARLAEQLPDEQVPAALAELRSRLASARDWPPRGSASNPAMALGWELTARASLPRGSDSSELIALDFARMADLVDTYADLPLGTTDVAVIALAERARLTDVATLDHRHFTVVRVQHAEALTLLP